MPITRGYLPALSSGTPEQVAWSICFDKIEHDNPASQRSDLGVSEDVTWEQVLATLRSKLNLPSSADWQDIYAANSRQLAVQLGLPSTANWQQICRAENRRVAILLGLAESASWQDIYSAAISNCAVQIGLSPTASWQEIYGTYIVRQHTSLAHSPFRNEA